MPALLRGLTASTVSLISIFVNAGGSSISDMLLTLWKFFEMPRSTMWSSQASDLLDSLELDLGGDRMRGVAVFLCGESTGVLIRGGLSLSGEQVELLEEEEDSGCCIG